MSGEYADKMLVLNECGALLKDLHLASINLEDAYRSNRTPEAAAALEAIIKKYNDALKDCTIRVKKILDDCSAFTVVLEKTAVNAHKAYLDNQHDGTFETENRYATYLTALNAFRSARKDCWENNKITEKYKIGGRRKSHKSKRRSSRRS